MLLCHLVCPAFAQLVPSSLASSGSCGWDELTVPCLSVGAQGAIGMWLLATKLHGPVSSGMSHFRLYHSAQKQIVTILSKMTYNNTPCRSTRCFPQPSSKLSPYICSRLLPQQLFPNPLPAWWTPCHCQWTAFEGSGSLSPVLCAAMSSPP